MDGPPIDLRESQPTKLGALLTRACSDADPGGRERAFSELLRLLTIFVRAGMGDALRRQRDSIDICQSVVKSFVGELQDGKLSFPNEGALVAYLQQVVRTKLAEAARRDGAWKRGGRAGKVVDVHESGSQVPSPSFDPTASGIAAAKEEEEILIAGLTPEDQELIRLRRNGMEWDAIGDMLGRNPAALRKVWSRLQQRVADDKEPR